MSARLSELLKAAGRARATLLIATAVLGIGFVLTLSAAYSTSPTFNALCTLCHSMRTLQEQIAATPHGSFSCQACHSVGAQELAGMTWEYLTRNPPVSEISEVRLAIYRPCVTCHRGGVLDMLIHRLHLGLAEQMGTCTFCHGDHSFGPPGNEYCYRCHNPPAMVEDHRRIHDVAMEYFRRGTVTCQRCHSRGGGSWFIPIGPDSMAGVSRGVSCLECHQTLRPVDISGRNCVECHAQ